MTLTGAPMAASGVGGLPALRFRTAFGNYEAYVRAATLVAGFVIPVACIALFLWLLPGRDLVNNRGLWLLLIIAVVSPAVFLTSFGIPHTVALTPTVIQYREVRRRSIPTRDVTLIASIAHPRRAIFAVMGRGREGVAFGPGLSKADIESARNWLRSLGSSIGIGFRENMSVAEAMVIFARKGK